MWASAGNELVNLIFGVWLEDSFGLQIAALAGASAVIGFSELGGESLAALLTDRIGKPRALAFERREAAVEPQRLRVDSPHDFRSRFKRYIDWEKETPPGEIRIRSLRSLLKKTARMLKK